MIEKIPYSKYVKYCMIFDLILSSFAIILYAMLWMGFTIRISTLVLEGDETIMDRMGAILSILRFAILAAALLINLVEFAASIFVLNAIKQDLPVLDVARTARFYMKVALFFLVFLGVCVLTRGKSGYSFVSLGIIVLRSVGYFLVHKFIKELEYEAFESGLKLDGKADDIAASRLDLRVIQQLKETHAEKTFKSKLNLLELDVGKKPAPRPPPPPIPPRLTKNSRSNSVTSSTVSINAEIHTLV